MKLHWMMGTVAAGLLLGAGGLAAQDIACDPMTDNMALEGRASPYDSLTIDIDGQLARICYGRPSSRGRTMIGGEHVPYGELWRTGANEPTTLHLSFPAAVAGIALDPGSYSIYTVPGLEQWVVILNESTGQWGHEGSYTPEVQAQEVGRATVAAERLDEHVETLTLSTDRTDDGTDILLEWENTRVRIPIQAL